MIAGIVLLAIGGDYLVKGGVNIARSFKVSSLLIGMTVISFGTSAPEFIVSLGAVLSDHPQICLGNVIGSNIANIGLALGITLLIAPLAVKRPTAKIDLPFMLLCSIALLLFMWTGGIERWEGLLLFLALIVFIAFSIRQSKKVKKEIYKAPNISILLAVSMVIGAALALTYGSRLLITGATEVALDLGVSERIIAISMIALGTSIPEIATSVVASFRKETDIAIGNIIGSNIFNILFVIGATGLIHPINGFDFSIFQADLIWMLGIAFLLYFFVLLKKRDPQDPSKAYSTIGRTTGFSLLIAYIIYITLTFLVN